jgi:hypothetical protein
MKTRDLSILFLLLAACAKTEQGIDQTVIRGNIIVPPVAVEEPTDADKTANDDWFTATELPMLTYREMDLTGSAHGFGTFDTDDGVVVEPGNSDCYILAAKEDGLLDVSLSFETQPGMGRDKTILGLNLYDLDNAEESCTTAYSCAPVEAECACEATYDDGSGQCVEDKACKESCTWEVVATETCLPVPTLALSSDGTLGDVQGAIEVSGGGNYGIEIVATDSTEYIDEAMPYSVNIGALTPDDDVFLVGAYGSDDITAKGNPLGGGSVYDMQWDEVERAWVGKFEMLHIKSVETTQDTAENSEDHVVTEGADVVYLLGGTLPTLNASIPSGSLYSSTAVMVDTSAGEGVIGDWGDTAEPETEPMDTADTAGPAPVPAPRGELTVVIDQLQPRVVGWEYTEEEPNEVTLDDSLYLVLEELGNANVVPDASLDIYTDIIRGDVTLDTDFPNWASEYVDVFAITVPEDTNATFTFEWGTPSADHDFILYGSDGYYYAYSLYAYPEIISTSEWGFHLEAGSTWYLLVLPYAGILGDDPYTIEIEYAAL